MKTCTLSTTIFLLVLSLLFTACGSSAVSEAPAIAAPPAVEASAPVEAPAPTLAPTEAPPPLPCTIAFETNRDGNREIYSMAPDGKDLVNLTNNPADDLRPSWSPDGSQIAFVSSRENEQGNGEFIYVMNADGSDLHLLTNKPTSDFLDWSNDGGKITFINGDDVYVVNADGKGEPINLTNSPEKDARSSWSPDGKKIAWISDGNIFVMDSDGSNVRQLTKKATSNFVEWTIDGQIFTWMDNVTGMDDITYSCHNCVMDADGKNITSGGGKGEVQKYLPFWTLDGNRVECGGIAFPGGDSEIYLISEIYPDALLNLTNNKAEDLNADWPANCGPVNSPVKEVEQPVQIVAKGDWVIGYKKPENQQKAAELLKACSELQIECIEGESLSKLAEQNVDAIVYPSNNWDVMGSYPEINAVAQKGIPLVVLDAETGEPGVYNLSNESDSVRSGLDWMFKEMGGEGEFVYFNFGQNSVHEALIGQALKDNPGITATSMPADFEGASFTEESLASLMKSDPAPKAIWSDNRQADMFWMLKNINLKNPPAILCEPKQEMLQFWRDLRGEKPSFRCFSTINPGGTAYEGIYVAFFILNGEKVNPAALGGDAGNTFIYDYPKITNDNLDEWLGKIDSFRKGEWDILELPPMTPEEIKQKWFIE